MDSSPTSSTSSQTIDYNDWLFEIIKSYLKGRVLEVQSDLTSISKTIVEKGRRIHLSTSNKLLRQQLIAVYQDLKIVRKVHYIDFQRPDFDSVYPRQIAQIFDTILAVNSPTKIYNQNFIYNCQNLLRSAGHLIILLPAMTALYNGLQSGLNELKLQNSKLIKRHLGDNFQIAKIKYFENQEANEHSGYFAIIVAILKQ